MWQDNSRYRTKNKIIAITGVTGAGKDYLANIITKKYGIEASNMGTLVAEKLAVDRDLMMSVTPPKELHKAQLAAYRDIVTRQPRLITCHAIRPGRSGFGYAWELEEILNPLAYVFVAASPEVIFNRVHQRNKDNERKCHEISIEQIRQEQEIKLSGIKELSSKLGCNLLVIDNTEDSNADTTRQFDDLIDTIVQ